MIGAHLSISALRCARSASGVARFSSHGLGAEIREAFFTTLSFSAAWSALVKMSMIGFGVPGPVKSVPHRDFESFQSRFVEGRNVRQGGQSLARRHTIHFDFIGFDLAGRVGGLIAGEIHLSTQNILDHVRGAFVRHRSEIGLDRGHEQHTARV